MRVKRFAFAQLILLFSTPALAEVYWWAMVDDGMKQSAVRAYGTKAECEAAKEQAAIRARKQNLKVTIACAPGAAPTTRTPDTDAVRRLDEERAENKAKAAEAAAQERARAEERWQREREIQELKRRECTTTQLGGGRSHTSCR